MITARKSKGATEPYYDTIRLTANGRAAVAHSTGGGAGQNEQSVGDG